MGINTELDMRSYLLGIEDSQKELYYVLCHMNTYESFCGIFDSKEECRKRIDFAINSYRDLLLSKNLPCETYEEMNDDFYIVPAEINKWV